MTAWLSASRRGVSQEALALEAGRCCRQRQYNVRYKSSAAHDAPSLRDNGNRNRLQHGNGNGHANGRGNTHNNHENDKLAHRDFFFDILNANATRRDAKQYLARFKSSEKQRPKPVSVKTAIQDKHARASKAGVNLGELYLPTRAAASSPTFTQSVKDADVQRGLGEMHVALVCMRSPHLIDDQVLDGIALTLAQLVRLDMKIVLTLNCSEQLSATDDAVAFKDIYQRQAGRVVAAIEAHNNAGARYVDSALSRTESIPRVGSSVQIQGKVAVEIPKLILEPLKRGAIPVIPAIAHNSNFRPVSVPTIDVMLALTRTLSDIDSEAQAEAALDVSLDRIIMLEPLGGLPSETREDKAHVFVNLEQEYNDIVAELKNRPDMQHQVENISTLRSCLALLTPASSALLISPEEAASVSRSAKDVDSIGITTRRQKNPLIHNLLTNKPMISSSLPVARLPTHDIPTSTPSQTTTRSTLIKRGMPLTIIPDPRTHPWTPPQPGEKTLSLLNNPDINLPRLVALIEDSFRRPLDVTHYLSRIENRIAGVIIAGEYEGGAILTWELPPHLPSSALNAPDRGHSHLVPYLDKFAVLQRSQGSSGVADVVFQAMVRSCFPGGVCWRSRKTNPVNKWYFERSVGTWNLQGTQWTMFWTGKEGVVEEGRWGDYVDVCRNIEPSWLDGHKAPD